MARDSGSLAPVPIMAYAPQEGPKKDLPASVKEEIEVDQPTKHGLEREAGSDVAATGEVQAAGVSAQRQVKGSATFRATFRFNRACMTFRSIERRESSPERLQAPMIVCYQE
jgi:hypothetical protein